MTLHSRLLLEVPGIRHAFLTAAESAGRDRAGELDIKQVHGAELLALDRRRPQGRPQVDGVFTHLTGEKIAITTADCLPLLMASRDGRFIAGVHAGWKGIAQGIVENSVRQFVRHGIAPADVVVAVGPHIRACCYEVSAGFFPLLLTTPGGALAQAHRDSLFFNAPQRPNPHSAAPREPNGLWFDLPHFCELHLLAAGIRAGHIDWLESCTYCSPLTLGSYRRRTHYPAVKTQQISWISRDEVFCWKRS
ncbi:polyphenol oxidase family protein [[Enterobacter] lignolyticus]|uniref:Purine nucleoside phosphorylase n=1 Tax=[Enterobacter] lignolyticus TaxID=1334193 RepID=A0A806X7H9_9ENTR|nr:polyphenol oxidase family protein [[Enterobacter] lignolyticus]ALR76892.1 hypothetical protein AO703_11475 [[Enterobacter] lignolyticus]